MGRRIKKILKYFLVLIIAAPSLIVVGLYLMLPQEDRFAVRMLGFEQAAFGFPFISILCIIPLIYLIVKNKDSFFYYFGYLLLNGYAMYRYMTIVNFLSLFG